jgi:hypothetical protein
MEEQKELRSQFRQQQEKYVYYIISIAVTAIGFSVYRTTGQPLKWVQIPLGLSVCFWGISIFCGLKFIAYNISMLYTNHEYLSMIQWQKDMLKPIMESNIKAAGKYFKWQEKLFYVAMILFIVWHILEMYCLKSTSS